MVEKKACHSSGRGAAAGAGARARAEHGHGRAGYALQQCGQLQDLIDISLSSLQGLRTKCAASNDLTQQEIRTLEVGAAAPHPQASKRERVFVQDVNRGAPPPPSPKSLEVLAAFAIFFFFKKRGGGEEFSSLPDLL